MRHASGVPDLKSRPASATNPERTTAAQVPSSTCVRPNIAGRLIKVQDVDAFLKANPALGERAVRL